MGQAMDCTNFLGGKMENEPVAKNNAISFLVRTAITLAVAFGLKVSAEQLAAIVTFVNALTLVVNTYFTRKKVTPV